MNTLMTILYLFSYGLKYYIIFVVYSKRALIDTKEFWNKVENINPNDFNTQIEIFKTFYWLNNGILFFWSFYQSFQSYINTLYALLAE
jgi:hypothetical protein